MRALVPFTALLISTALLVAGHALQNALIPLRGEAEAFGSLWVGGLGSGFFVGYALGCWFAPALVARVGHIRVFAAFVGLMSGTILLHPLAIDPLIWVGLRVISGFALATLYIIIESWLNERTDNASRGAVMSFYVIINFAMIAVGQMLLTTYPLESFALFTLASVLISFAAIPLAMSRATQPAPLYAVRLDLPGLFATSPVGVIATVGVGMMTGAFWAFGGVYATRAGLTADGAALFLTATIIGAAVLQWPVGRLSDSVDRRLILLGITVIGACVALASFLVAPNEQPLIMVAGFALGASVFPIYAISVAHTFDHAPSDQHVTVASGLLLAFAVGSIIGPLIASVVVESIGAAGMFGYIAVIQSLTALVVLFRLTRRGAIAEEEKEDFTLYATAPVGAVLVDSELEDQDIDLIEPEPIQFQPELDPEEEAETEADTDSAAQTPPSPGTRPDGPPSAP
ncbi:MAG: MFS transporter [Devosiaceae bacterium]|nr:MFS transporter [Devosiaceae bacterium MH13]